jgi:major membrane immunogen (membrane-anchored lipoprotein)
VIAKGFRYFVTVRFDGLKLASIQPEFNQKSGNQDSDKN